MTRHGITVDGERVVIHNRLHAVWLLVPTALFSTVAAVLAAHRFDGDPVWGAGRPGMVVVATAVGGVMLWIAVRLWRSRTEFDAHEVVLQPKGIHLPWQCVERLQQRSDGRETWWVELYDGVRIYMLPGTISTGRRRLDELATLLETFQVLHGARAELHDAAVPPTLLPAGRRVWPERAPRLVAGLVMFAGLGAVVVLGGEGDFEPTRPDWAAVDAELRATLGLCGGYWERPDAWPADLPVERVEYVADGEVVWWAQAVPGSAIRFAGDPPHFTTELAQRGYATEGEPPPPLLMSVDSVTVRNGDRAVRVGCRHFSP